METKIYTVENVPIDDITPSTGNPRKHNRHQRRKLKKLMKKYGFTSVIVIDAYGVIYAGEARWLIAKELGLKRLPCIRIEDLTEAELRAFRLADNRITDEAEWESPLLKIEFKELMDIGSDMELTGFDIPEIDLMLHCESADEQDSDEDSPAIPTQPVTQIGDAFALSDHRVVCGDTRDLVVVEQLMQHERAYMVLTDVPYNMDISKIRGQGKHQFANFPMAHSELKPSEFSSFLNTAIGNLAQYSTDGSLHYIFIDWRHISELHHACHDIFTEQINLCVWCKNNGGMGSFYRSQHELICVYKLGKNAHINNIELGRYGRNRSNVWQYPGLSSFSKDRDSELALHATPKNVDLLHDAILDATHPNHIVLDGFLGSGSTLIAAQRAHRRCFGIELDPRFVDVTILRWQQETGDSAIHIASGLTFSQLADQRANKSGGEL